MANDGSAPQAWAATTSSEVVDVLPCVPATATHCLSSSAAARAAARRRTGMPLARAAANSSCLGLIAVV